jgi:cyclopropane-fatty-acyl-phospholipid synthase
MHYLKGGFVNRVLGRLAHKFRANTREGSRRNILAHYDLGNAFFETWLDASMTYSAARFDRAADLETAQQEKYAALASMLRLQPADTVLEIGCGWGGFAEYAARHHGARVTAITISDEQFNYAASRVAKAGLSNQVEIRRQDYRDVEGRFDAVASIEMIEAVGEEYWPTYFAKLAGVLKAGGRAAIQSITIRDDLFWSYRNRADFIQHHIFPGGMLPSLEQLQAQTSRAGLAWRGAERFAASYAETLAEWARRFHSSWPRIQRQGYDERFRRLWLFYLAYCEAGFRTGRTDVVQFALEKH